METLDRLLQGGEDDPCLGNGALVIDPPVKLVESFFRNLKEGKNKLEVLRLARKEIRDAGYDHPFYWAPFILVGEVARSEPPCRPPRKPYRRGNK